ncbi:hypothetical protein [Streptomyces sp. DSM 41036]
MSIYDGDPWYLSPDVWVIPGDNPDGLPGQPIGGGKAFLKARVHNDGDEKVEALVRFYWAVPAVGLTRKTANRLDTVDEPPIIVSLDAGEQKEVLCPSSWSVQYLNGGHLCVLAEAFHPDLDPLEDGLNVPMDRHVAQRNLAVAEPRKGNRPSLLAFEVHNPYPRDQRFTLTAQTADPSILVGLAETSGLAPELLGQGGWAEVIGFTPMGCPTRADLEQAAPELEGIQLNGHGITGFNLAARLEGSAALVNITQYLDGEQVGGLSYLLLGEDVHKCNLSSRSSLSGGTADDG